MRKFIYCLLCVCFLSASMAFLGCTKPLGESPNKSNPSNLEDDGWTNNY
ncbi:MAG: hypothetical protein IJX30_03375 [Clostridia bacterium]|nr:hypothetical protein [Clostridia bacterium]